MKRNPLTGSRRVALGGMIVLLLFGTWWARPYVKAVRLLHGLEAGTAAAREVASRDIVLRSGAPGAQDSGEIRARVYFPAPIPPFVPKSGAKDVAPKRAPVLVLVHGVHYLGMDEPRLEAFARGLAREGLLVITPDVPGMRDYRVSPEEIAVIGDAALAAQRMTGARQVGLMGLSFSGGLALMAAAEPRYRDAVGYVIAVGAHASLRRVVRSYGTDEAVAVDGSVHPWKAHEYGELVVVYEHPEDFFNANEVSPEAVRAVLKPFLEGDVKAATAALPQVAEPARSALKRWIGHDRAGLGAEIVAEAARRGEAMAAVSPEGHLAGLRARVLLLHGAGDDVIPATEEEFLARAVPRGLLDEALVSPALSHVDVKPPGWWDEVKLVWWMGEMFRVSFEFQGGWPGMFAG
ncbi:MAG: hypothetical protein ABI383_10945 [Acidobacteriaceae bacterium]